jgi:hypothetical protein
MRTKKGSWLPFVVIFAACMLLAGSRDAMSASGEQNQSEARETRSSVHTGTVKDGGLQSFLQSLDSSYCESSCCWAWHSCFGGYSSCSDNYCEAWCPDGSFSQTWCWEK